MGVNVKIVLATSNQGKVKEFQSWIHDYDVVAYSDIMPPFEIEETGTTFKENALIKARAVYEKLEDKTAIVLSDDSGISVPLLAELLVFTVRVMQGSMPTPKRICKS